MTDLGAVAPSPHDAIARRLRAGLLGIAALGILGTAVELWSLHHWESPEQLIPWVVLGLLGLAVLAVAVRPARLVVRGGLALAAGAVGAGVYGIIDHVSSNLAAGPLDRDYGSRWATMGTLDRWWAAATGKVGPAPMLAPGVLAQVGLCLLLVCATHPGLARARSPKG